jgi:predicted metal-binding protein
MSDVNKCMDTDRCPGCLSTYEIVALKFHLFRPASTLMACISCGMVQSVFTDDRNYLLPVRRNRRRGFD